MSMDFFAVINWPTKWELYGAKDYIEKIDFQGPFFAVVNWPISEFYGASVCIMHYFDQSATNQLANVFLIAGCGFL